MYNGRTVKRQHSAAMVQPQCGWHPRLLPHAALKGERHHLPKSPPGAWSGGLNGATTPPTRCTPFATRSQTIDNPLQALRRGSEWAVDILSSSAHTGGLACFSNAPCWLPVTAGSHQL